MKTDQYGVLVNTLKNPGAILPSHHTIYLIIVRNSFDCPLPLLKDLRSIKKRFEKSPLGATKPVCESVAAFWFQVLTDYGDDILKRSDIRAIINTPF